MYFNNKTPFDISAYYSGEFSCIIIIIIIIIIINDNNYNDKIFLGSWEEQQICCPRISGDSRKHACRFILASSWKIFPELAQVNLLAG